AMIEALAHFAPKHLVETRQVHEHARFRVDDTANGHLARVRVTMKTLTRAKSEDARVRFVAPVRAPISMRGRECDLTRQEGERHSGKLMIFAGYPLATGAFQPFLRRRFRGDPRGTFRDRTTHVRRSPETCVQVFFHG